MKLIITILFCILAFLLMAAALHFSRYKKRKSGCCRSCNPCSNRDNNSP